VQGLSQKRRDEAHTVEHEDVVPLGLPPLVPLPPRGLIQRQRRRELTCCTPTQTAHSRGHSAKSQVTSHKSHATRRPTQQRGGSRQWEGIVEAVKPQSSSYRPGERD